MSEENYFDEERERAEQDGTEYQFSGGAPECAAMIPMGERIQYLPRGESQNIGEEKSTCASRGPDEDLEAKMNFLYQNDLLPFVHRAFFAGNSFIVDGKIEISDAYIGILSGTTRTGNSLKAPLQAIHDFGIVPKKLLPQLSGFDENLNPARITDEIKAIGKKSLELFDFNYDQMVAKDFSETMEKYMIVVAGHAWPLPIDGVYPRTERRINHVFLGVKPEYLIRDSYKDVGGTYLKQLAPDFKFFDWGYRIYITIKNPRKKKGFWEGFCSWNWSSALICTFIGKKYYSL